MTTALIEIVGACLLSFLPSIRLSIQPSTAQSACLKNDLIVLEAQEVSAHKGKPLFPDVLVSDTSCALGLLLGHSSEKAKLTKLEETEEEGDDDN